MFGLFEPKIFRDGQLGELRRSGDYWKGSLVLEPCGTFCLALIGSREAPDIVALDLARELPKHFPSLMWEIQTGLFEHFAPYKEAVDAGEETGSACPSIANAEAAWPHVKPEHVLIGFFRGVPRVEIGFRVAWDIEHTIGARFENWQMIEMNGSVLGI